MCRNIKALLLIWLFSVSGMAQARKTVVSAQVYGYQREMVYFDCLQTPLLNAEFHTNPGEEHLYVFETDKSVCMLINGKLQVLVQPGDSIHAVVRYEGKKIQSAEFTGTPQAVCQNQILWNIELLKRSMRYKSQLLGCVVLDVKPKDRLEDSRKLLEKTKEMIGKAGEQLTPDAVNYIMASVETDVYNSLMEYPVMYAETRKLPVDQQEIGDYWTLMDSYTPRSDKASLRCNSYASLLMRYCFYSNGKKAHEKGVEYVMPDRLEDMYQELAVFYEGAQRDFVLYTLLCNFIREGRAVERADVLLKDYKEKYNKEKEYIRILDTLLQ